MLGICPAVRATYRYAVLKGGITYRVVCAVAAPVRPQAQKNPVSRLRESRGNYMLLDNLSGKVWENGEFSVGILTKLLQIEKYVDARTAEEIAESEWRLNLAKVHGYEKAVEFLDSLQDTAIQELNEVVPLGLSNASNSHKRKKRGETGISTYARHVVKNAAYRMQIESGKNRMSFLTLTLPNVDKTEAARISANWSEIIRVFVQWLGRQLRACGLSGEVVGVTEIQEKRLISTGVFALHFHCVFEGRKQHETWCLTPKEVREQWSKCLSKYLDRQPEEYNWNCCENIQRVKKDASGYLGKYLSKGAKDLQRPEVKEWIHVFPSSWWTCSNSLKAKVSTRVKSVSGERGRFLLDMCTCNEIVDAFKYVKPVVLTFEDNSQICIGWYGQLNNAGMEMLFT